MKTLGLYVHIPFCERKCNYCDFYSITKSKDITISKDIEKKYVSALIKEIESYRDNVKDYVVDTIFIGGGTPSYLNHIYIGQILDCIRKCFNVSDNAEIAMEANPNSITEEKAVNYRKYGINRMSVGIQSLNDDILKIIGRLHSREQAIQSLKILRKVGFDNINADIIFNLPKQTEELIDETLETLIKLDIVKHISFYSLILEEGTPLYNMEEKGLVSVASDDEEREMYYSGRNVMRKYGFNQYEISNFSLEGYECKHNIKYWTGGEYIGFGPFSHSCFKDKRYNNISDIKLYCDNIDDTSKFRHLNEVLDKHSKMFEYIMLRLRMNKGFELKHFKETFEEDFLELYKDKLENLLKYKLINIDETRVSLTEKGMDISNYVFEEFLD